jgi:hypothetical protein
MAYERAFVTTFAIGTGDSDFTPLVHKLRAMDKRVIGIGVASSTSALLPPACDEFLFYDRLPGVEALVRPAAVEATPAEGDVGPLVVQTLAGLARHSDGPVLASRLKRAILRKDPTFDEADHGFRGFGELLRHLAGEGVVTLGEGSAQGDPQVGLPEPGTADDDAFALLVDVVRELGAPQLSGLKNQLRKRRPEFSEKRFGFNSFLSFVRAARARGLVGMAWDDGVGDYVLRVA